MKTNNVILRPMGQFQVQQRTKDRIPTEYGGIEIKKVIL